MIFDGQATAPTLAIHRFLGLCHRILRGCIALLHATPLRRIASQLAYDINQKYAAGNPMVAKYRIQASGEGRWVVYPVQ